MKVMSLNHYDTFGGAARAAYRIHHAMRTVGVDSLMRVNIALSGDFTIVGPAGKWTKGVVRLRPHIGVFFSRLLFANYIGLHSPAILPSGLPKFINDSDADLLHMHWVNDEMLSIGGIGRIRKPIVWTLHDMWAFCGAEHYTENSRWREGYTTKNRPKFEGGFDLNRWVWQRKCKAWLQPIHIVTPSNWLANCVRQSALMRDWPVTVVPNAIDTDVWQPVDKGIARKLLNLPPNVPLLLFGAMGGGNDPRKGFDLLRQALLLLRSQVKDLQLVIFGQLRPSVPEDLGFPVHYVGHLYDDLTLRVLYSAVDVMIIPSLMEVFGQTALEANACGVPAIGFDNSGVSEIITHQRNGYLARAFDVEDLARGIQWVLSDGQRYTRLSVNARQDAVAKFSYPVVGKQYLQVYDSVFREY